MLLWLVCVCLCVWFGGLCVASVVLLCFVRVGYCAYDVLFIVIGVVWVCCCCVSVFAIVVRVALWVSDVVLL